MVLDWKRSLCEFMGDLVKRDGAPLRNAWFAATVGFCSHYSPRDVWSAANQLRHSESATEHMKLVYRATKIFAHINCAEASMTQEYIASQEVHLGPRPSAFTLELLRHPKVLEEMGGKPYPEYLNEMVTAGVCNREGFYSFMNLIADCYVREAKLALSHKAESDPNQKSIIRKKMARLCAESTGVLMVTCLNVINPNPELGAWIEEGGKLDIPALKKFYHKAFVAGQSWQALSAVHDCVRYMLRENEPFNTEAPRISPNYVMALLEGRGQLEQMTQQVKELAKEYDHRVPYHLVPEEMKTALIDSQEFLHFLSEDLGPARKAIYDVTHRMNRRGGYPPGEDDLKLFMGIEMQKAQLR